MAGNLDLSPSGARGITRTGWLDSRHTFSFGDYHDPAHTGFGVLRVLNEDRVAPGAGFPAHSHRDAEIISIVLSGALEHRDSMGNGSIIRPGDVQRMSAGSGVRHSEFNPSATEPVHFLQIWLLPHTAGLAPGYAEKAFAQFGRRNTWQTIVTGNGEDGALMMNQDAALRLADLAAAAKLARTVPEGRVGWLQVISGGIGLAGHTLKAGDGIAALQQGAYMLNATENATLLAFDLPD